MAVLETQKPARVLGTVDAGCVVIGAIIGVGIFFTPSKVAAVAGSAELSMLSWAIAGAIALCGALAFAELGGRYHSSGAQYEILRDAYGPMPAFLFVFCNATAIQAGATGIIAVICAQNLSVIAGREPIAGGPLLALAAALIVGLMAANVVGVKWGARVQNVTVFAKVLTLLAVTVLAVFAPPATPVMNAGAGPGTASPIAGVLMALVPALFSYGGWQHALWISGEVKEPRKTLPRAIVGGVVLVVAVYLLANWAYLHLLGHAGVVASRALAADAVAMVYPGWGRRAIAAAVAVSAFGVLNAQLLSGPRLIYAMSRDGRFFEIFGRLLTRLGTPAAAITLLGVTAIVLLLAAGPGGVDKLLNGAVFIDGIFFALTGAALIVLRRKRAKEKGDAAESAASFRVPGYPIVPLLFVVGEAGVVAGAYLNKDVRDAAFIGMAWIAGAAALYFVRFRGR